MSDFMEAFRKFKPRNVLVVDNSDGKYVEKTLLRYVVIMFLSFILGFYVRGGFL
jgi:hypothetical protein